MLRIWKKCITEGWGTNSKGADFLPLASIYFNLHCAFSLLTSKLWYTKITSCQWRCDYNPRMSGFITTL